tara:strand:+ start:180 stop:422 length:243 start_codon:yes stop_codon:yes gene_type:complete
VALAVVKLVLLIKEETVDPEEVEDLILLTLQVLMVAQEMFLTQVQLLQEYKALTEDPVMAALDHHKLAVAVAEPVKLEYL